MEWGTNFCGFVLRSAAVAVEDALGLAKTQVRKSVVFLGKEPEAIVATVERGGTLEEKSAKGNPKFFV